MFSDVKSESLQSSSTCKQCAVSSKQVLTVPGNIFFSAVKTAFPLLVLNYAGNDQSAVSTFRKQFREVVIHIRMIHNFGGNAILRNSDDFERRLESWCRL